MYSYIKKASFIFLVFSSFTTLAQNKGSAQGKVINAKDKSAVEFASVAIKRLIDSANVGGGTTKSDGTFKIANLAFGKYRLYVAFLGFKPFRKDFELSAGKSNIDIGFIALENVEVELKAVEIKGAKPLVVVKEDTLEINASTLKVKENAVVEDLLKKVPGVEVSKDGAINTQGETVKRVKVDGKDFMGKDPLAAIRNLPADMVDKIQIIDELSDQAKFTGVDDGNREKILNIVTKTGIKNKGWTGNNTIGYGSNNRYDVNLSVNHFNESQQISLIGQFNNANKQNFGGGLGGGMSHIAVAFGGGAPQSGITTTNAGGINFADTYKNNTQINGSYFFNKTSVFDTKNTYLQNFIGNNTNTTTSDQKNTSERLNHRFDFTLDAVLNSTISVKLQPNIAYTQNLGNNITNYARNTLLGKTIGEQNYQTNSKSPNIYNDLLIRKKFKRIRRTISLNINTNIDNSDEDNYNKNPETLINPQGDITQRFRDQQNDIKSNALNNSARLVYTEPLSKILNLEFNFQNEIMKSKSQRFVYDFNNATQQYDIKNGDLSNQYENQTLANTLGMSINGNEQPYKWNLGLKVQQTHRKNDNLTTGNIFNQNFINLIPLAQFRYKFTGNKKLTVRYRGNTNQPSIAQIQPIPNNTNTQTILIGNPNLKPSFTNNLFVLYNSFDPMGFRMLTLGGFVKQTINGFGNNQSLITNPDDKNYGKIGNSYVNVSGNISADVFSVLALPVIKGNKLNFQVSVAGSYKRATNITSNIQNVTNEYTVNNGYKLVSNLEKLDLTVGISGSINKANYTIGNNAKYYIFAPDIDISYVFPGSIRLQTDITYNKLTGRGAGFDTEYMMMNAFISRLFFNNRGTFKLSVNDLLNQNTGISRTTNSNSIVDQNFNVLKRYYMLSFTYSISNIAGLKMPPQEKRKRVKEEKLPSIKKMSM